MSILSVERYRSLTHDAVTADGDVTDAIADATNLLGEEMRRPLELAERTEVVEISGGFGYPLAKPIIAVDGEYQFDTTSIRANELTFGVYGDLPISLVEGEGPCGNLTITYTGGYTEETLPVTIARAIAEITFNLTRPVVSSVPSGATSIKNGDVSISFGPEGTSGSATGDVSGPAARTAIKRYGRRMV